jgi:5-methyltetrahydrofolate--homocysteine methyltransferase
MSDRASRIQALKDAARERIIVLDGAWGTEIQKHKLTEDQLRGERFADAPRPQGGNLDLLAITMPELISQLHDNQFEAGADIASTNTFSSTSIAQADYGLGEHVTELNLASARLARAAADRWTATTPDKPRWVAGSIGPTNVTLSMSADVNDPGARAATWDELYDAYREQALALIEGGVDLLLVETIFDTLNAKAAIKALLDLSDEIDDPPLLWISGTITDRSGRTLSGQTVEAFWNSMSHARPFAIGFNCALGADLLRPHVADMARAADTLVSAHPNAGLPNDLGGYDEQPDETAAHIAEWARSGLLNIVGGCCGTSPAHIAAIAAAVEGVAPRAIPEPEPVLRLSGLEPFTAV